MKKAFYLDDWLVEPDLDRIRKGSLVRRLRPQVMDLLVYLASRPREIVSNEEILSAVWPGRVTTQASVYNCLKDLRHGLFDDPHEPTYIETIPKRGYRLIARVKAVEDSGGDGGKVPGRFTGRQLVITAAALLLAVVILVDRLVYREPVEEKAVPDVPEKSIAVLPFTDMSPGGDQTYFADGIAEEILDELAQSSDLRVTARSSSFVFRDSNEDLRAVGQKLGVAYVLEGSVRKDTDRVRVTAQLVDTRSGFHLWSREYDREIGEILDVQGAIGLEVANALQVTLSDHGFTTGTAFDAQELNPRVYDLFLQAKNLINQKRKESLLEAVKLLHEVIEVDPGFARARVLLADSLVNLAGQWGVSDADSPIDYFWVDSLLIRLTNEMTEIISKEPGLAEAHMMLGKLTSFQGLTGRAETALLAALKINPNLAEAHFELGRVYLNTYVSVFKTITSYRRAVELDPYSSESRLNLALALAAIPEMREEGWAVFRAAQMNLQWTPLFGVTEANLLRLEGRYADAIRVLENTLSRDDHRNSRLLLARYWFLLGESGRAREIEPFQNQFTFTEPDSDELTDWQRCPKVPKFDPAETDTGPWQGYVCMWRRKWAEAIDRLDYLSDPDEILRQGLAVHPNSVPITLALAHKRMGNGALAEQYAAIEQAAVDGRTENGKIRNGWTAYMNSRLLALRGDNEGAMDELSALLDHGDLDYWIFEHPVFDELRDLPRFRQLQNRRLELVNVQRAQLGLEPLSLNP